MMFGRTAMSLLIAVFGLILIAQGHSTTNPASAIGFDQNINAQIPLNLQFRDESGNTVQLSQYFKSKPVILAMVYYECPMLCTEVMNGIVRALNMTSLAPGDDYQVVTVSVDPAEKSQLAAQKKASYVHQLHHTGAATAWHCLTGDEPQIKALADTAGFRYYYDPALRQYAHAAGIVIVTPTGKISRYFFGIDYSPSELQTSLRDAAGGKPGKLVHQLLLLCYHYDPATGKYSLAILKTLRLLGGLTVAIVALVIWWMLRRERKRTPSPQRETSTA